MSTQDGSGVGGVAATVLLTLLLAGAIPTAAAQEPGPEALPTAEELRELEATYSARLGELVRTLRAGNEIDRDAAVLELARIGLPAHRALAELLGQEPWELRRAAAEALGRIRLTPVVPTLLKFLADPNWSVREAAVDGLGRFTGEHGRDALLASLDDPVWRVKVAALDALALRREIAALPRILALADSPDEDVRYGALEALVSFEVPEAKAKLAPLLNDPDPEVRRLGLRGILGAEGKGDPTPAVALVRDPHMAVRIEALHAVVARLGVVDPAVRASVEELVAWLGLEPYDPRYAYAAGFLEQHAEAVAEPLRGGLRHANAAVRRQVMLLVARRQVRAAAADVLEVYSTVSDDGREEILRAVIDLGAADPPFLLRVAREGNPSERAIAMLELGRTVGASSPFAAEAVRVLFELLAHPEPELRKAAGRALYASGLEPPLPALLDRLRNEADDGVFSVVVSLLIARPGVAVTNALVELYDSLPAGFARVHLAQAIAQRPDREAELWVRRKLADPDAEVRRAMVGAARGRPSVFLEELLALAKGDADGRIRAGALGLLAEIRDERVFTLLVEAARDLDLDVRDKAIKALALRRDPRAIPPLLEAASAGEDVVRREALDALLSYTDDRVVEVLLRCATADESEAIRSHAVLLLQRVRDPRVVDALLPRVREESAVFVKNNLAYTLGMIGDRRALEAVIALTRDPEPMVRATAALVLGLFPPPLPADALRALVKDADPGVRLAVVEALAALAAAESRDVLFEALLDADSAVRRRALLAVGSFQEPAAEQAALQAALKEVEREAPEGEERSFRAGQFLMRLGLEGPAHRAFAAVLAAPPEDSAADAASRFYLGYIDLHHARFESAAGHLESAAERYPQIGPTLNVPVETLRAYAHAARALQALKERKEASAKREIAEAETLMNSSPEILNLLAWNMVENDLALPLALELGERALRAAPESPAILDTVGWILYRLGRFPEALDLLRQACRLAADDPDLAFHHARVLMANGQRAEAFESLKRAVMREPGLGREALEAAEFRAVRNNEEFRQLVRPGPKFVRED